MSGYKLKEKAIKRLILVTGALVYSYFYHLDPLAELITAYGQHTLKHLENFVGGSVLSKPK
ncbi:MAG: hypothetical protein WBZ36_30750 [Candidatus Nitrosopolaris sp.]